jgi:endonuclease/exonuclease/phosphatase family metal-dependent hydrolase
MVQSMTAGFRLGTWNIREAVAVAGNVGARAMILQILAGSPLDVLALQEVPFDKHHHSAELDAITVHSQLRYSSAFPLSPSVFNDEGLSGLAVISRTPLRAASRFRFPNPLLQVDKVGERVVSWDKGMLLVQVGKVSPPLYVASLHGFPFHMFRRGATDPEFDEIWKSLADELDQIPGTAVVAGDFNTDRLELISSRLTKHSMRPLINGVGDTLDDILCDTNITQEGMTIKTTFSDHPLFIAELSFTPDLSWT